jgi:hypothetical protein
MTRFYEPDLTANPDSPFLRDRLPSHDYATSSDGNSEGFSLRISFIELRVGVSRKGDQRRKTGAAFPAVPNVTDVLVGPILGPYGRNQCVQEILPAEVPEPDSLGEGDYFVSD